MLMSAVADCISLLKHGTWNSCCAQRMAACHVPFQVACFPWASTLGLVVLLYGLQVLARERKALQKVIGRESFQDVNSCPHIATQPRMDDIILKF